MSVNNTKNVAQYTGDGATTSFGLSSSGVPIPYFAAADWSVNLFDTTANADVSPQPVLGGAGTYDYTIATVSTDAFTGELTGNVVFNNALLGNHRVTATRAVAATSSNNFLDNSKFPAVSVNAALDRLTMLVQQVIGFFTRAIQFPSSDPVGLNTTLPPAATRAGMGLAFDAQGQPIAGALSAQVISAPMLPVVQAASLAVARTALGLGVAAVEALGADIVDDGSGNLTTKVVVNAQAVQNYPIVAGDRNKIVTRTNASAMGDTLPNANTLPAGWKTEVKVLASSVAAETITPAAGTIDGLAAIVVQPGRGVRIFGDGTSYLVEWLGERRDYIKVSHNAGASGSNGGATSAGAQNVRPFNVKDFDTAGLIGALSAGRLPSLPAGTYDCVYQGALFNPNTKCRPRLRDDTHSTTLILGIGQVSAVNTGARTSLRGRFTITAASTIGVDEWTQGAEATDGLGAAISSGENEVFGILELVRL